MGWQWNSKKPEKFFQCKSISTKNIPWKYFHQNILTQVHNIFTATRKCETMEMSPFKKCTFSMAPQRKVLKFKKLFFDNPMKNYQNQWENYDFCIAKNMKNRYTEWRFLGDYQKRLQFEFKHFFTFPQKIKILWGKKIRKISFWRSRK
mgnify:CR=1 FL=1